MYRCLECGFIFEDPKLYSEDRTPDGAFEGGYFIERWTGCPYCSCSFEEFEEDEEDEE